MTMVTAATPTIPIDFLFGTRFQTDYNFRGISQSDRRPSLQGYFEVQGWDNFVYAGIAALQTRLLDKAAGLLKPGGRLVYCTCSLEPEEGERQAERFLARHPHLARRPVEPGEVRMAECVTPQGDVRTLPFQMALTEHDRTGLDGFFVARFVHKGP